MSSLSDAVAIYGSTTYPAEAQEGQRPVADPRASRGTGPPRQRNRQAHRRGLRGRASLPGRFALSAARRGWIKGVWEPSAGRRRRYTASLRPASQSSPSSARAGAPSREPPSHRRGAPCLIGSGSSVKSWEPCPSATGAARKSSRNIPSNSRLSTKRRSGRAWTSRKRCRKSVAQFKDWEKLRSQAFQSVEGTRPPVWEQNRVFALRRRPVWIALGLSVLLFGLPAFRQALQVVSIPGTDRTALEFTGFFGERSSLDRAVSGQRKICPSACLCAPAQP